MLTVSPPWCFPGGNRPNIDQAVSPIEGVGILVKGGVLASKKKKGLKQKGDFTFIACAKNHHLDHLGDGTHVLFLPFLSKHQNTQIYKK